MNRGLQAVSKLSLVSLIWPIYGLFYEQWRLSAKAKYKIHIGVALATLLRHSADAIFSSVYDLCSHTVRTVLGDATKISWLGHV